MAARTGAASRDAGPSPAVAPPPGNPRFPLVDSVRALAVLAVVAYHVAAITGDIGRPVSGDLIAVAGAQAVSVLFMTSGFLLYRPFVRARAANQRVPSPRRYLRRRLLRIIPAYWFALTVLAIFPGITGVFSGDWWRYYLFLQVYSVRTLNSGIPVAWTLSVEMTFYLLLPIWAFGIRRVRPGGGWVRAELWALAVMALFGVAIQIAAARLVVSQIVADTVLGNCTWFAVGMALAVASVAVEHAARPPAAIAWVGARPWLSWLVAAMSLIGATAVLQPGGLLRILLSLQTKQPYPRTIGSIVLTGGVCVGLIAPALLAPSRPGVPQRVLGWAPLMWVGLVSYGVYLWHLAVVSLLGETSDPAHFSARGLGLAGKLHPATTPILFVLTVAGTCIVAWLSYRFVELPFLRRKEGPLVGGSAFAGWLRRVASSSRGR